MSDQWKDEVIEALVVNCILRAEHEHNPRLALADLIAWEIQVALDPMVSSDAAALIERGRREQIEGRAFSGGCATGRPVHGSVAAPEGEATQP